MVFEKLANRTHTPVAKVIDIINFTLAVLQIDESFDDSQYVFLAKNRIIIRRIEIETHVEFDTANSRQVITLRIEEQSFEQSFCGFTGWRLARTHDTINVGQRAITVVCLVDLQCVTNPGTGCDMIDIEQLQLVNASAIKLLEIFHRHFVTGFDVDLTGFLIDQIKSTVATENFLGWNNDIFHAVFFSLVRTAWRNLVAAGKDNFTAISINNIKSRFLTAPLLRHEWNGPAVFRALVSDTAVKFVENIFFGIALLQDSGDFRTLGPAFIFNLALNFDRTHGLFDRNPVAFDFDNLGRLLHTSNTHHFADLERWLFLFHFDGRITQRTQQRGHRQFTLAVNTNVDDIFRIKFEVQPRTAIRNNAGGEQELTRTVGLATVMIKQNTGRTVHLADDNALGTIDDERTVLGHQWHVAHINVLLFNIENGACFCFRIDFKDDQAQRHFHRRCIGDAALTTFFDIIFGIFELVVDEIHFCGASKIADRENAAQRFFQTGNIIDRWIRAQELLI